MRRSCLKNHFFRSLNHRWCFQNSEKLGIVDFYWRLNIFYRKQFDFTPASSQPSIEPLYFQKRYLLDDCINMLMVRKIQISHQNWFLLMVKHSLHKKKQLVLLQQVLNQISIILDQDFLKRASAVIFSSKTKNIWNSAFHFGTQNRISA